MSSALDQIKAQIAQAQAAAGASVPTTTAQTAQVPVVAALPTGGRRISLSEAVNDVGTKVDKYLKTQPAGFVIGTDTASYYDEIEEVTFEIGEVRPFYGLRFGNPPTYKKSFDRVMDNDTKRPWAEVVAEAQRADPKCKGDYICAEFAFRLGVELTPKKGDPVPAGTILGFTPAIMNAKDMLALLKPYVDMMEVGRLSPKARLKAKLVHEQKTKTGVQPWGHLHLVDLDLIDTGFEEEELAAA